MIMPPGRPARALAIAVMMAALSASACVTRTRHFRFEVRRGATLEDRVENAKKVVSDERIARLKNEVKLLHPTVTDADLERFSLRWSQNNLSDPDGSRATTVTVTVSMEERGDADAAAVVETAARILDAEVNGPEHSGIPRK